MKTSIISFSMLLWLLAAPRVNAEAQVVRVQQPIVQQFSSGTTLTVPDRGSAILGGIQSGAIQSRQTGPFRRGSTYGHAFQSSTSSVSVYIHDFEAMDQMLLNSAPRVLRHPSGPPSAHQHWRNQLLNQNPELHSADSFTSQPDAGNRNSRQSKADRYFELGRQAEKKHASPTIAILHYRNAEKYGSVKATARLQELSSGIQNQPVSSRNSSE